jgi:flagellar basal body-associated protein FliL
MDATDDASDETMPAAPAKGKAIPIFLGLNTLLLAGVMVFVLKRPATASAPVTDTAHAAEGAAHGAEGMPGPTLKLESFIIQLKAVESDRYVRVAFDLELGSEADKGIVTARMSPLRDSVISFFSDRSLEELRGSVGMERTKAELLKRLASIVPEGHIKALYITDFVVQ